MPDTGRFSAYCAGVAMDPLYERLVRFDANGLTVAGLLQTLAGCYSPCLRRV